MNLMNGISRTFLDLFVMVLINDILVNSHSEAKHRDHLQVLLQLLKGKRLYGKLSKYEFGCIQWFILGAILY